MTIKKTVLGITVALCFCGFPCMADGNTGIQKQILTVDDAVKTALETHVDIQRSSLSLSQAERGYKHSWNSLLPSVSASGTGTEKRIYKDADTDTAVLSAGISASLTIDSGLGAKIKKLESKYEAGKTSYDDTVRQVETMIRESFYNLLYLQQKLEMSRTTLASYQRQYDQTKQKYDKGVAPELDLLSAQVNLETAKPDVDSAETAYATALHEFLDTIGIEDGKNIELSGSLDYAESAQTISYTVLDGCEEKSSEVRELEGSIRTAQYSKKSTYGSLFLPSITAGAAWYPEQYSYERKSQTDTRTPYWNISLGISLPLDSWLPGSSAHDTVAQLDDTVRDYQLQLADKKKTVRTSAAEKLHNIEQSQKTLKARHLNLDLAKRSYQMTEDAYQRGTKDLLTLQTALDTMHSAELQLRSEQYNLICNVLDLEKALCLPSGTFFTENK